MTGHTGDADLGWWVLSGRALLDALRRTRRGEDPDMVYAELYANARITPIAADPGEDHP